MSTRPWHLAPCLAVLRAQINAAYPNRSIKSDGTIGDEAHAATKSEHNPDPGTGTVRAFDITHDPVVGRGVDGNKLAAQLVSSRDSRILYVIWNRRIARSYPKPGIPAWSWSAYTGPDPHTNHVHLSVTVAGANNKAPWRLIGGAAQQEEDDMTPDELLRHPLGENPSSHKPSTVSEQVRIAANYSFLSWQRDVAHGAQLAALTSAVQALAANSDVDGDELLAVVKDAATEGVAAALKDVELTLSTTGDAS